MSVVITYVCDDRHVLPFLVVRVCLSGISRTGLNMPCQIVTRVCVHSSADQCI